MGLIHSRAAKKRNRAEAALLKEQTRQLKDERHEAEHDAAVDRAGDSVLRQPTLRDAIRAYRNKTA